MELAAHCPGTQLATLLSSWWRHPNLGGANLDVQDILLQLPSDYPAVASVSTVTQYHTVPPRAEEIHAAAPSIFR